MGRTEAILISGPVELLPMKRMNFDGNPYKEGMGKPPRNSSSDKLWPGRSKARAATANGGRSEKAEEKSGGPGDAVGKCDSLFEVIGVSSKRSS